MTGAACTRHAQRVTSLEVARPPSPPLLVCKVRDSLRRVASVRTPARFFSVGPIFLFLPPSRSSHDSKHESLSHPTIKLHLRGGKREDLTGAIKSPYPAAARANRRERSLKRELAEIGVAAADEHRIPPITGCAEYPHAVAANPDASGQSRRLPQVPRRTLNVRVVVKKGYSPWSFLVGAGSPSRCSLDHPLLG